MDPLRISILTAAVGLICLSAHAQTPPGQATSGKPGSIEQPPMSIPRERDATLQPAATQADTTQADTQSDPGAADGRSQSDARADSAQADTKEPDQLRDANGAGAHHPMDTTERSGHGLSAASFVTKAGQDGLTEVKLAELALAKSKNADVRQFATRMSQDHAKANADLMQLAAGRHMATPTRLDTEHQALVERLSAQSGGAFDTAYSEHMAAAHGEAIALFQAGANSDDGQIAGFAHDSLPTLAEHKRMADSLASKMKIAAADRSAAAR